MTEISPKQAVKYVRNLSDKPDYDFIYKNKTDQIVNGITINDYIPTVPRYKCIDYWDGQYEYYIVPYHKWTDFDPVVYRFANQLQNSTLLKGNRPWGTDPNDDMKSRVQLQNISNPFTGSKCIANTSGKCTYIQTNVRRNSPMYRDNGVSYMWSLWWSPVDVNHMRGQGLQLRFQAVGLNGNPSQWGNSFHFGPAPQDSVNARATAKAYNPADGSFEKTTGLKLEDDQWYYIFGFIYSDDLIYQNFKKLNWSDDKTILRLCVGLPDQSYISDPSLAYVSLGAKRNTTDHLKKALRENLIKFPLAIVPSGGDMA